MKKSLKIIAIVVAVVLVVAIFELWCPPTVKIEKIEVMESNFVETMFFAEDGFSANSFKDSFVVQDFWCMDGLKSDFIEDYSFVRIEAKVRNLSLFGYTPSEFVITSAKEQPNNVICALKLSSEEIKGMHSGNVIATVLISSRELNRDNIESAIRGLTLKTKGGERSVLGLFSVPSNKLVYKLSSADKIDVEWQIDN